MLYNSFFAEEYIGKKIINITNENDSGDVIATIKKVIYTCNSGKVPAIVFEDENGKEFSGGGFIFPYNEETLKFVKFVDEMFNKDQKKKFDFYHGIINYDRNMAYVLKNFNKEV